MNNPKQLYNYAQIGQDIGWDKPPTIAIPNIEVVESTIRAAREGDEEAFKNLFYINRFASNLSTPQEAKAIFLIFNFINCIEA